MPSLFYRLKNPGKEVGSPDLICLEGSAESRNRHLPKHQGVPMCTSQMNGALEILGEMNE